MAQGDFSCQCAQRQKGRQCRRTGRSIIPAPKLSGQIKIDRRPSDGYTKNSATGYGPHRAGIITPDHIFRSLSSRIEGDNHPMTDLLAGIHTPADLKNLTIEQLKQVAVE